MCIRHESVNAFVVEIRMCFMLRDDDLKTDSVDFDDNFVDLRCLITA
jgi:hypothetical protein